MSALNIYLLRFKKPTMSLTAMARENALLERSTESNSAPSGTGIDLGDPAEYLSWHHDRSGTLGWERANGGCETPVVSCTSFACPGRKGVHTMGALSKCVFQCSARGAELCGENADEERICGEVSMRVPPCSLCHPRAILTHLPPAHWLPAFQLLFLSIPNLQ